MMKTIARFVVAAIILFTRPISAATDAGPHEQDETKMKTQTGYAPINGLKIYYEIHGTVNAARPPLVLLHGGGDTIKTSFGHLLPALARDRQIIAFEQQGFGHTADIADRHSASNSRRTTQRRC